MKQLIEECEAQKAEEARKHEKNKRECKLQLIATKADLQRKIDEGKFPEFANHLASIY